MKKLKVILVGSTTPVMATLPQNVQQILNTGLAVVFDGLNDIPGGVTAE